MSAQLTLDELDLLPVDPRSAIGRDGYYFETGSDDTNWSNAEAVIASVTSEMFEGASIEVVGWESVTVTVKVRVIGVDSAAVATGAVELIKVCRREAMKALVYTPPDGTSPPTVFDVLAVTWRHEFDDMDEDRNQPRRTYTLSLHCKPFPRSSDAVSSPAVEIPAVTPTFTLIDDGSSATNWSTTSKVVAREGLVTNPGVSGFLGTSGWVKGSNCASMNVSGGYLQGLQKVSGTYAYVNAPRARVTPGVAYRIYGRMLDTSNTTGLRLVYRWYRSSGSQIGSDVTTQFSISSGADVIQTLSLVGTAPANAYELGVFLGATSSGGDIVYARVDMIHIERNDTWTGAPFDGSTPDGATYPEYAWSGSARLSTSLAYAQASVSASSGYVRLAAARQRAVGLTRTASFSMGSAPFLAVTGQFGSYAGREGIPSLSVNGAEASPANQVVDTGTDTVAFFVVDQTAVTSLKISIPTDTTNGTNNLNINKIETATSMSVTTTTGRAGDFLVPTYGTMPAEAAIEVGNATDLGRMVLIHTRPAALGFAPALRARRISGPTVTTASANISGFSEALATTQGSAVTWEMLAADLPAASYLLAARLSATGLTVGNGYVLNWRAYMVLDGATETSIYTGSRTIKAAATTWGSGTGERITEVALLTLPTMNVLTSGDASAKVRVQLWATGGGTWNLDESWLFDSDKGDLSVIEPVSALHRLELLPASADRPVQSYLAEYEPTAGNITTRDIAGDVIGWSQHRVDPRDGELAIYVATLTTTPTLSALVEYHPRWDVYAAPIQIEEASA
ncbi:MAG TPA: hypothetical protein VIP28_00095 [Nocardioides sp.]